MKIDDYRYVYSMGIQRVAEMSSNFLPCSTEWSSIKIMLCYVIKTSSGLFGISQAFVLVHVVRRVVSSVRNLFMSFGKNVSTLNT